MKRFVPFTALLLCIGLFFLLSACGGGTPETQAPTQTEAPAEDGATQITLSGSSAAVSGSGADVSGGVVTVTEGGTYVLTGSLTEGRVLVNAPKETVTLVLSGAEITCSYGSPLYIYKAGSVKVYLTEGTENVLTDGAEYTFADECSSAEDEEPNACLYSKADLTIAGPGSLTVNANYKNGVTGKDNLTITDASLTVTAKNHGVNGKDSLTVENAALTVVSGGDAVRSTNDKDETLGWILLNNAALDLDAGEDGVQAETTLTVNGGSYTLRTGGGSGGTAEGDTSAKGLKAGSQVTLNAGTFSLDCLDDAIHSNGSVAITGGSFTISTGDDGVHADEAASVSGGEITISACYEGLEGQTVDISGGEISITASDDGVNAAGGADQSGFGGFSQDSFGGSQSCAITISGGKLIIDAQGDGIDSNGSLTVSGGEVYISGPTGDGDGAIDYDGSGVITGGTVVAVGSAGMAQNFGSGSAQGSILVTFDETCTGEVALADADGNVLLRFTPGKAYRGVVLSCAGLEVGQTYTVTAGDQSQSVTLESLIYGGSAMGGPGGQGGFPGGNTPPDGQPGGQGGTPPDGQPGEDGGTPADGQQRPEGDPPEKPGGAPGGQGGPGQDGAAA